MLLLSHVRLFVTPWTVARQAPLSVGFFRQENWSGLSFPSPGDLPDPGFEPLSPVSRADSLALSHLGSPKSTNTSSLLNHIKTQIKKGRQ